MNAAFKAVADATRRRILQLLRDRDLAAGDIAAEFDISWPSISHHLKVLREADLVLVERQGQELIYSLNTTVLQEFAAALLALLGVRGEESDEV
ncbi:MAG TPA: autorepressor SdpR family transcription factor [Anaerolineales bacterium]